MFSMHLLTLGIIIIYISNLFKQNWIFIYSVNRIINHNEATGWSFYWIWFTLYTFDIKLIQYKAKSFLTKSSLLPSLPYVYSNCIFLQEYCVLIKRTWGTHTKACRYRWVLSSSMVLKLIFNYDFQNIWLIDFSAVQPHKTGVVYSIQSPRWAHAALQQTQRSSLSRSTGRLEYKFLFTWF